MSNALQPTEAPAVTVIDGKAATSSMDVAAFFEKNHFHVMRSIRDLLETDPGAQSNFGFGLRPDANGQQRPYYTMDRTGFVMLGMGFTGAAAIRWRRRYIAAFDAMEAQLTGGQAPVPALQQRQRNLELAERIPRERNEGLRQLLHAELAAGCASLGEQPPSLQALAADEATIARQDSQRAAAAAFWQIVRALTEQEYALNHARAPGVCGLSLKEIRGLAEARGQRLGRIAELRAGFALLEEPEFLAANQPIHSRITGRTMRCWLFATAEFDDTPGWRRIQQARQNRMAGRE